MNQTIKINQTRTLDLFYTYIQKCHEPFKHQSNNLLGKC